MAALLRQFVLRDETSAKALWGFLKQNWAALAQQGKPLAITVTEWRAKRSGQANRRYWAILNEISSQAWINGKQYSKEAWHHEFAGRFIGWEETPGGHMSPISTTTLDIGEFSDYMTKIEEYAASELGLCVHE